MGEDVSVVGGIEGIESGGVNHWQPQTKRKLRTAVELGESTPSPGSEAVMLELAAMIRALVASPRVETWCGCQCNTPK
jgi:hypothetical protein